MASAIEVIKTDYTDEQYFVGYSGDEPTKAEIESALPDGLEIASFREAGAPDANTSRDLKVFSRLFEQYEEVALVTVTGWR